MPDKIRYSCEWLRSRREAAWRISDHAKDRLTKAGVYGCYILENRTESAYTVAPPSVRAVVERQAQRLLNKLTPEKYESLAKQFVNLVIGEPDRLPHIVNMIFDTAATAANFSAVYANLCGDVAGAFINFHGSQVSDSQLHTPLEEMAKTDPATLKPRRLISQSGLLAELSLKGLVPDVVVLNLLHRLIKLEEAPQSDNESAPQPTQTESEAAIRIIEVVGKAWDGRPDFERVLSHIQDLTKVHKVMRVRLLLMNVGDLQRRNWEPRRRPTGPQKLTEGDNILQVPVAVSEPTSAPAASPVSGDAQSSSLKRSLLDRCAGDGEEADGSDEPSSKRSRTDPGAEVVSGPPIPRKAWVMSLEQKVAVWKKNQEVKDRFKAEKEEQERAAELAKKQEKAHLFFQDWERGTKSQQSETGGSPQDVPRRDNAPRPPLPAYDGGTSRHSLSTYDDAAHRPRLPAYDDAAHRPRLPAYDDAAHRPRLPAYDDAAHRPRLPAYDDVSLRSPLPAHSIHVNSHGFRPPPPHLRPNPPQPHPAQPRMVRSHPTQSPHAHPTHHRPQIHHPQQHYPRPSAIPHHTHNPQMNPQLSYPVSAPVRYQRDGGNAGHQGPHYPHPNTHGRVVQPARPLGPRHTVAPHPYQRYR